MKQFLKAFAIIFILTAVACCKKPTPPEEVVLPSNLTIEVTESTDTYGLVNVEASATNANFYTIIFKDLNDSLVVEANDGKAEYQFTETGTYTIAVKAHASYENFIRKSKEVSFEFDVPDPNDMSGYTTPLSYAGYNLVWNDEFDGSSLNTSDWNYEIGTGSNGWGNSELQYYLEENTSVGNGVLTITAKAQVFNTSNYTSSRLTTQGKQSFQYGRIDIRAKLPFGQGMWPALWMLGNTFGSSGWPSCGEIDIMEMVGGTVAGGGDDVVHGTVHWDNAGSYANYGENTALSSGIFADEFHVFSIIWDDQAIRWYMDDQEYVVVDITPSDLSEFHQPFFFIFNVAVGGTWPGSPDATTTFPQEMKVDYVRVFQK